MGVTYSIVNGLYDDFRRALCGDIFWGYLVTSLAFIKYLLFFYKMLTSIDLCDKMVKAERFN